ncbi:hypothetical protein K8R43_04965 [archaeon]|nr:hypothetical protein [archaeon]
MEKKTKYMIIALIALFVIAMLILAALVVGMVFVVLGTTFSTRYPTPALISQDKSVCAASGIQLLDYTEQYEIISEADGDLKIRYIGETLTCRIGSVDRTGSTCVIGQGSGNKIRILVSKTECALQEVS